MMHLPARSMVCALLVLLVAPAVQASSTPVTPVTPASLAARSHAAPTAPGRVALPGLAVSPVATPPVSSVVSPAPGPQVPFRRGASLKAVHVPEVHADVLEEPLLPASVPVSAEAALPVSPTLSSIPRGVYVPGTVVSFTVPAGLRAELILPEPASADVSPEPTELPPTPPVPPAHTSSTTSPTATAEPPAPRSPILFPPPEGVYGDELAEMLQATAEAPDHSRRQDLARENLALFYLTWQRPQEAMEVLANLPRRADGLPQNPIPRLLLGVARLAAHHTLLASERDALFDQKGVLAPHAALWKAVAMAGGEDYTGALAAWPTQRGILPTYPPYLRALAQEAQVATMVTVGNKDAALKTVDALVAAYEGAAEPAHPEVAQPADKTAAHGAAPASESSAPPSAKGAEESKVPLALVRWQAIARLGTPREFEGLRMLAQAAEDTSDPIVSNRAKFDFVQALRQRKELSDVQAIDYLTRLGMEWRGDSLEREVLKALADLYDGQALPREALTTWRTLVRAFPTMPDMPAITHRMTETFLRAFDPENPKTYDTLTYLGLYFDFRELVPNDARGDALYEQVANLLADVTLFGRAAPLLEQQLRMRPLDSSAQAREAILLARSYRNVGRGGDALQVLDKYQRTASTTILARDWKREEARTLLDLERPSAAAKALVSGGGVKDDDEARRLLVDAYWGTRTYSPTIPLLEKELASVTPATLVSNTAAQLAVFRLGYAYGQQKNLPALHTLLTRYGPALAQLPALSDGLGAIAAGGGASATVPQTGPLAPIANALNGLNALTERVISTRKTGQDINAGLEEFDKKMKYLELLPPPVM